MGLNFKNVYFLNLTPFLMMFLMNFKCMGFDNGHDSVIPSRVPSLNLKD